jgi:hypothetical protein
MPRAKILAQAVHFACQRIGMEWRVAQGLLKAG